VLKKDRKFLDKLPQGTEFFKGCINGFSATKNFFCLEQFEELIMSLEKEELDYKIKIRDKEKQKQEKKVTTSFKLRKNYADTLGKKCAAEYLYKRLSEKILEK